MPDLTRSQRKNLAKLADYLESLPEDYAHFEMRDFTGRFADQKAVVNYALNNGGVAECGTVACAIGHGPAAGILFKKSEITTDFDHRPKPDWWLYSERFVHGRREGFEWAFGSCWRHSDNHHYGAAARIRYLLKHGAPPKAFREGSEGWRKAYREFDKRYAEQVQ